MELIAIPQGEFMMGDNSIAESAPQHRVLLQEYAIAKFPVTNSEYEPFVRSEGYAKEELWTAMGWKWRSTRIDRSPGFWFDPLFNLPSQPVVGVSWYEAVAFCSWLNEQAAKVPRAIGIEAGLSSKQVSNRIFRLPTEAEWEKAARGPNDIRTYPWGSEFKIGFANTAELQIRHTTPVDSFPEGVSPFGIWDMAGNTFEWTASKWGTNWQDLSYPYPYRPGERDNQEGSWARVMRGGSWFNSAVDAMCARRARYLPGSRGSNIGFRVVCGEG
jgi:formylglycine-generating enzyme required for sulfatase activity